MDSQTTITHEMTAEQAYLCAKHALKGPFPAGETAIAKDPGWAYVYAKHVLKGPFPAGEAAIAKDEKWAAAYEKHVLKEQPGF